ncbi:MAG: hypothetical protein U0931_31325 [Vulcanimicrobiota bacterium]
MATRAQGRAALSILDLTVAMGLLMVLLAILFAIFFLGGKAWRKTDDRYELLRNTQTVIAEISREAERTNIFSLSILPGRALSFLSPMNSAGNFVTDALGDVRWERYLVFYHEPTSQEVRMVDVPLLPASFERRTPQPIDRFLSATGIRPLSSYLVGGRVLGRHITLFEPAQPAGSKRLTLTIHTVQPSTSGAADLTLDISASALMRN